MKIGFDLDKIFVDYPPLIPDSLIDRLYKKSKTTNLEYRYPKNLEQKIRQLSHHPLFRPTIQKNLVYLESIHTKDNSLFLISSRFRFLKNRTDELMKRIRFDKIFDGMYFNFENEQPHEFKNRIIQKLQLDKYIDDDFQLLTYVAKKNKDTMFYWLNKKRRNEKLTRNIIAITSLSDIFS